MKYKKIILTGAAGHVGSTLLRMLGDSDTQIRALLLPEEAPVVEAENIQYFKGDVTEKESLRSLFENAAEDTLVIHAAAVISIQSRMTEHLWNVNVNGVRNVTDLCIEHSVGRLIHISSVHAIPELPKGQVMKEVSSYSEEQVFGPYAKTKAAGAQIVLDAVKNGLDAIIVLPSGIIGPYDSGRNHMVQMAVDYLNGKLPAAVQGGYAVVDVRDVADGCLKAAEFGRTGESYLLSSRYADISEILGIVAKIAGKKPLPVLPVWVAILGVPFIGLYSKIKHERPLYTSYALHTVKSNSSFSNEKAVRDLGFSPRPLNETIEDMVSWLQSYSEQDEES